MDPIPPRTPVGHFSSLLSWSPDLPAPDQSFWLRTSYSLLQPASELHAPRPRPSKPSTWWFLSQIGEIFVYLKKKETAQGKPLLSSPSPHWLLFFFYTCHHSVSFLLIWPRSPDSNYSVCLPPGLLFWQEKNRVAHSCLSVILKIGAGGSRVPGQLEVNGKMLTLPSPTHQKLSLQAGVAGQLVGYLPGMNGAVGSISSIV